MTFFGDSKYEVNFKSVEHTTKKDEFQDDDTQKISMTLYMKMFLKLKMTQKWRQQKKIRHP